MKLDPELAKALQNIKGADDWNTAIKKLLESNQRQIETEEEKFQEDLASEKPESVQSKSHKVTAKIKKYLSKRSQGKCEHPNCKKTAKHIHHIEPFAIKKKHDPDKLLYICEEHHRIIHLGYIDDSKIQITKIKSLQWRQIEKLPSYDIKNLINYRISEYRHKNLSPNPI